MNRWEKEVQQSLLDSEEAAIKELEAQYTRALNDINAKVKQFQADIDLLDEALSQDGLDDATKTLLQSQKRSKIYQQQYQQALKGQVSAIIDKMHGDSYATIDKYLNSCYETAYVGTMYDMTKQGVPIITPINQAEAVKAVLTDSKVVEGYYNHLGVGYAKLKKTITQEISRGIASSLPYRDIARNINNVSQSGLNNAKRIARTEGHRIQQTSTRDAQLAAKAKGADVVKQWDAALDGRTRDSHRRVDGEIRELDEKFSNGLMFPGDSSGPAAEVINCRCTCDTRARWALDESELQILKERAEYFGLDKTANFEEYRKKYLAAVEAETKTTSSSKKAIENTKKAVENTKESGIIKSEWDNDLTPRAQVTEKIEEDNLYSWVSNELGVSEDTGTKYVDAVLMYTDDFFTDIRKFQRGEKVFGDVDLIRTVSEDLETYIKTAPRWNGGTTFRGCPASDEVLASYQPGAIIEGMNGTASWSGKVDVATEFAKKNTSYARPNAVVFHCDTQGKGTGIRHISVFEHEDEVLVSKDSRYEVIRTEPDNDGINHVYLREVT